MKTLKKGIIPVFKEISGFIYSYVRAPEMDLEQARRSAVFAFFLFIGVLTLFPFSIAHFSQGNTWRAVLLLFVGSIQAVSLILLRYLKKTFVVFRVNVILLGVYFLFLVIIGGTQGARILWMFVFPLAAFFLLGKREGLIWSSLTFFLSWLLFTDPHTIFGTFPYAAEVKLRFSITYILLVLMAYFFEATRQRYQEDMEKERRGLQFEIQERRRVEEELRQTRNELELRVAERTAELKGANERLKNEIEERKEIEKAHRAAEEERKTVLGSVRELVIHEDPEMRIVWANQAACEAAGLTQEEIIGRYCYEIWPKLDKPCPDCPVQKAIETGKPQKLEKTMPDERVWFIRGYPVRNEKNEIIGGIEVTLDITERKQAEASLREAYNIINRSPIVAFLWKNELGWPVEFVSDNVQALFGYSAEEFISGKVGYQQVVYPKDLNRFTREMANSSQNQEREAFTHQPYRIVTQKGDVKWVEDNTYIRRDENGQITHYQGIVSDITIKKSAQEEKERLQAQLLRAQKLEAIGTLAGGIAHDFNNLLMGIQGRTSLMMNDPDTTPAQSEHLKGINDYVRSATDLTGQLLGFARGGKYEVVATDLNEVVRRSADMFGRTRKDVIIHKKHQEGIWMVDVERRQIEQVLLNLFINAWHAMPGGGDVYLQTENTVLDKTYVKPFEVCPGKYVKISVTDTGSGMDEATRQRIFDPFFTTKAMGLGTGLGLASTYGIIKNHNGIINVYSEKGQGSTFTIYLPACDKKQVEKKDIISREIIKGTGRILLVDDEELILKVGREMLQKLGYKVLIVGSGEEAVEIYRSQQDHIDMVILDMVMPNMDGGKTYDRLKQINPGIKVLLSSGYSLNGKAQSILDQGCNGFIQKPFNLEKLSQKVMEVIGQR
jgi:two-component system, cell cycle sensor histidine kinase and response regulator CckA